MSDWYLGIGVFVVAIIVFWVMSRAPKKTSNESRSAIPPAPASAAPKPKSEPPKPKSEPPLALPKLNDDPEIANDPTLVGATNALARIEKIVFDEDAAIEEPTSPGALILVSAKGQSDRGVRRKRNEDSLLVREDEGLFVVADGMGGYRGGELASSLAVQTIENAFTTRAFEGLAFDSIPKRASELVRAIQMANDVVLARATTDRRLEGMGTTVCAARFSPQKQRLYIGHVGDSRIYCMRDGRLQQMTADHTMKTFGLSGESAAHLSRAVGIWPSVPIDVVLGLPRPGDVYLLCSDGLTKMLSDEEIEEIIMATSPTTTPSATAAVERLIEAANEKGGNDNVSVIIVTINAPPRAAA
jgi:protein phosphatase